MTEEEYTRKIFESHVGETAGARSAASPSRVALAVKGWRCYLGWHRWKLTYVCDRTYLGGRDYWEVYEECSRCGEERSYDERNRRVAEALREVTHGD